MFFLFSMIFLVFHRIRRTPLPSTGPLPPKSLLSFFSLLATISFFLPSFGGPFVEAGDPLLPGDRPWSPGRDRLWPIYFGPIWVWCVCHGGALKGGATSRAPKRRRGFRGAGGCLSRTLLRHPKPPEDKATWQRKGGF